MFLFSPFSGPFSSACTTPLVWFVMARGNEENTPSATQNRGGAPQEHGTRKRKRVVEEGMGDEEGMKKLTSRQLALKQKVEGKEVAEALFPRTAGFSLFSLLSFLSSFFSFLPLPSLFFFSFPPFPILTLFSVKQLSEEEKFKKSQQVEKRKRQKEEQMEAQKDAILRKIANAVNARSDPTAERKEKPKFVSFFLFLKFLSHVHFLQEAGNSWGDSVCEFQIWFFFIVCSTCSCSFFG